MTSSLFDGRSGTALALYGAPNLRFKEQEGDGDPIVLITLPKSGTYMLAKFLENIGLIDTEIHLSVDQLSDYRDMTASQKRAQKGTAQRFLPINIAAGLVGRGQFAVGHLPPSDLVRRSLATHRKVFLYRELRACMLSYARFIASTGRDGSQGEHWTMAEIGSEQMLSFMALRGRSFLHDFVGPLTGWYGDPDVLTISFETLMGDHGDELRHARLKTLCDFIGQPASDSSIAEALALTLNADTKTYSGQRSDLSTCWTRAVDDVFCRMNGLAFNERLGIRDF